MFKNLPNSLEANFILNKFKDHFEFVAHEEKTILNWRNKHITNTSYKAMSKLNNLNLDIVFPSVYSSLKPNKELSANIIFTDNSLLDYCPYRMKDHKKYILSTLDKIYSPKFDNLLNIISWFTDEGIKSGLINFIDKKGYEKNLKSHLFINQYSKSIVMTDINESTVYFNNILQNKNRHGYNHFKKSYINIEIVFLAHSDNTMHPYFKVRLPYSDNKKITCLIALGNETDIYIRLSNSAMPNKFKYIDETKLIPVLEENICLIFRDLFKSEIVNIISKKLKIKKSELINLSIEDLKEHFIFVEMVSI